ncbi:MAG: hypothetical protein HYX68_19385 [Planctomycetes bacterium]|nr:hypothetical protein [Planctomycetota bacterium]
MKKELLCAWLGVPVNAWPPDPWTLLGLTRGEKNPDAIEQRVQECMAKLRGYQLSYPDEATEGMNRLAEAFITLAEGNCKPAVRPASSKDETMILAKTKVDWRDEPPPVRLETMETVETPLPVEEHDADTEILTAAPFIAPIRPKHEIDSTLLRELAQESEEATSHVGTIDAVIERIEMTRRLLHSWDRLGKVLKFTSTKVAAKEADFFTRRMAEITTHMMTYPAFVGQPGKPGYRVVALARMRIPLLIVRAMSPERRDELLFDWKAGRLVLLEHRKYLRRLFHSMRKRTKVGLFLHAARAFINDYPWQALIGAGAVFTLAIATGLWLAWR